MLFFFIKRILTSIPVLIGISLIAFTIIQLPPGDYANTYKNEIMTLGGVSESDADIMAQKLRVKYGLDKPVFTQYLIWIKNIITEGNFGYSFSYQRDVSELILERLPRTLLIALLAHAITTVIGILLGIYVARYKYSIFDNLVTVTSYLLTSVPRFSLALIIYFVLVFHFDVKEVSSLYSPQYALAPWSFDKLLNLLIHIAPVVLIAGLGGLARNIRVMRGNLLDVINSQYIQTARSKGLKESKVIIKHAVPNALHPIIMYQGMIFPYMIEGELEAAIVLSIPTMAPMFYTAILKHDIYVAGSFLFVYGIMLLVGNILADLCLAWLDPRIST